MNNMFIKKIYRSGCILLVISLAACVSMDQPGDPSDAEGAKCVWVLPLYEGALNKASDVGIIQAMPSASISMIDGIGVRSKYEWIRAGCGLIRRYPNRTNGYQYHLAPGPHALGVTYETSVSRTKYPTTLFVNIEAGKIYGIGANESSGKVSFTITEASPELKKKVIEEFQSFLESRSKISE